MRRGGTLSVIATQVEVLLGNGEPLPELKGKPEPGLPFKGNIHNQQTYLLGAYCDIPPRTTLIGCVTISNLQCRVLEFLFDGK